MRKTESRPRPARPGVWKIIGNKNTAETETVKSFIEINHRNPSRHNPEERFKYCNWLKHNKKLLNAGEMKEDSVPMFEQLLVVGEKYRRVNQYE